MIKLIALTQYLKDRQVAPPEQIDSWADKDGDIVLVWLNKTKVEIYIKFRPLNCPKDLTANIALDLSTDDSE